MQQITATPLSTSPYPTASLSKEWNQNPAATKSQIGIWHHWRQEAEGIDLPLTGVEVGRMKAFLRRNAPTSYFELFANERHSSVT
jgi:hypothetical protein